MSVQERKVKNIAEYLKQVSRIKEQWRNSVLAFRGQEDEGWGLESSAERRLKNSISQGRVIDQSLIEYHKNRLEKCKLKNYDKREGKPLNELELLADLRHYGAATCLIDFTRNALVALWFSCEKTGLTDSDGKVFVVNTADEKAFLAIAPPDIENQSIENILRFKTRKTRTDEDQVRKYREPGTFETSQDKPNFWYWTPAHLNERITAQHSLFLFGLPSVSGQLPSEKIIIESESKAQIRQELQAIHDIHEESLFPDFVGFAYTQRHNASYATLDAEGYFRRGVEAHQRGDFDLAIQDFDKAIALKSDDAKAYYNRGVAYGAKGDYDHAIQDYNKVIALKPGHAEAYNNRGVVYKVKGDHDHAIQDYDKAIALNPDNAEAYNNRGVVYKVKGDHDHAIQDYDKAIALKLDNAETYNNRGVAYGEKGDHDHAIQDFDKAIALNPDHAVAYCNRGVAYGGKGDYDHAIQDFDKAIALNPDHAEVYRNRGVAYRKKDDLARAIQEYDKAIALKPDADEAYQNRGIAYVLQSEFALAIQDFDKAIALKPDLAEAYCLRGVTWLILKECDKARSDLIAARTMEVLIAEFFSSMFGSISNFERHYHVRLPDDIAEMLTP